MTGGLHITVVADFVRCSRYAVNTDYVYGIALSEKTVELEQGPYYIGITYSILQWKSIGVSVFSFSPRNTLDEYTFF